MILLLCVEKKAIPSPFWIYQLTQISYISIVLLRKIREKEKRVCVCEREKKALSLFGSLIFVGCNLE